MHDPLPSEESIKQHFTSKCRLVGLRVSAISVVAGTSTEVPRHQNLVSRVFLSFSAHHVPTHYLGPTNPSVYISHVFFHDSSLILDALVIELL